jgi:putrescine aminotransferase
VTTTEEIFKPMMYPNPFMHTTTTGGGALACSAAIAPSMSRCVKDLWEQAAEKGNYLMPKK